MMAFVELMHADEIRQNRAGPLVKATHSLAIAARSAAIATNQVGGKDISARLEDAENVLNALALAIDAGYKMEWLIDRVESLCK